MKETGRELEKAGSVAGAHSGLTQVSGSSEKAGESLELWEVSGAGVGEVSAKPLESPRAQVFKRGFPQLSAPGLH